MNAVKSCLVVLAAAVLASCSADPTASSGGKDVTISASPAAVSLQLGSTTISTSVIVSGTDALGGSVDGLYSISGATTNGAFTATVDTSYRPVYAGSKLVTQTRINVVAVAPGVGSFTVSGPGGTLTVPVRIYPDAKDFVGTYSTHTPALQEVVTVTAPAGIRFTAGTGLSFVTPSATGGDSVTNGVSAPVLTAMTADSATLSFINAPYSHGVLKITGVSTTQTPTLTVTVKAPLADSITPAVLDTGNLAVNFSTTTPAIGDTITATLPTGLLFTASKDSALDIKPTNGGAKPVFAGWVVTAGDTVGVKFIAAPNANGKLFIPRVVFKSTSAINFSGSSAATLVAAPPPAFVLAYTRADNQPNTRVTITLPSTYKATPASVVSIAGSSMNPIPLGISADSDSVYVLLPPSSTGAATISHVRLVAAPYFDYTQTDNNASPAVAAVTDQGGDDPAGAVPTLSLPALGKYGIWDLGSFTTEDASPDAGGPGINSQVYRLQLGVPATLISDVRWSVGRDVDVMLLADSNTTDSQAFGGFSGATGTAFHEVQNSGGTLPAATYMLDLIDWSPAYPDTPAVGATIRIAITAQ